MNQSTKFPSPRPSPLGAGRSAVRSVGSWFRRVRVDERGLSHGQTVWSPGFSRLGCPTVPMHDFTIEEAFHEPKNAHIDFQPLTSFWFMVPMHARRRKGAFHEPKNAHIDFQPLTSFWLMVPMHARRRKRALHEPQNHHTTFPPL